MIVKYEEAKTTEFYLNKFRFICQQNQKIFID